MKSVYANCCTRIRCNFLQNGLGANSIPKPTLTLLWVARSILLIITQFLALSQAFEDTGVRAYKATNLISTPDLLTAALQIHSVEAIRG
jgi:hypothetical protein